MVMGRIRPVEAAGEERPIGGLGIHIVRSLVDQARYRREGGRNHLHLIRHIAPATRTTLTGSEPSQQGETP